MTFAVADFQDLIRLLDAHPEWRAELRQRIFTDELLQLPAQFRELADAQRRTEARVEELAEAQRRTETRVEELAEAQRRTEERLNALIEGPVAELIQAQSRMQHTLDQHTRILDRHTGILDQHTADIRELKQDVATLKGSDLERRYRERAASYFGPLLRKLRVVDQSRLADMLDDAVDSGTLTEEERRDILRADVVLTGQMREAREPAYVVIEASIHVDEHDVERAAARATALAKLGQQAIPVVAGEEIAPPALTLARERGVVHVLDGRS